MQYANTKLPEVAEMIEQSLYRSVLEPTAVIDTDVPYIHQLWGTSPDFNGTCACGPTSAVMVLAALGKLYPIQAPCSGQDNPFGYYVSKCYQCGKHCFTATSPDPWEIDQAGAYGAVVRGGLAYWAQVAEYLQAHDCDVVTNYGQVTREWVADHLQEERLLVVSGQVFGYGHLIVVRGITEDGRYIVNDPYGDGTKQAWGKSPNGERAIYTWEQIDPKAAWAVR